MTTQILQRRRTLLTIPALQHDPVETGPAPRSLDEGAQTEGKDHVAPAFYALLAFILLALLYGIVPSV